MTAKGSGQMVVFAMHVIGDGTAYSNKPCARDNREKPAPGYNNCQYLIERHARLAVQYSLLRIQADKPIQTPGTEMTGIAINTAVAVAAPVTVGKYGFIRRKFRQTLEAPVFFNDAGRALDGQTTPAAIHHSAAHRVSKPIMPMT